MRRFARFAGLSFVLAVALATFAVATQLPARPAAAGEWWCWDDPTLVVGGRTVHVDLGVPFGPGHAVHGSTLVITVPANVPASLSGTGARNFPISVTLVRAGTWSGTGAIPVSATAVVNGPPVMPVAMKAWQSGGDGPTYAYGTAGTSFSISLGVAPSGGWLKSTSSH